MLQVPNNGENILNWARKATKEINSNIIHNGIGIRVLRSPQGTNISITSVKKTTSTDGGYNMPFDVLPGEAVKQGDEETSQRVVKIMTCGHESNILYTIGSQTKRIRPLNYDTYEKELTVSLPSLPDNENEGEGEEGEDDSNVIYIVVKFNYTESEESESEEDNYFPHDYDFDVINDIDSPEDIMSNEDGFQMIPIAYIQAVKSVVPEEDSGTEEEEPEPEPEVAGAYRTTFVQQDIEYALVQMYHGDIHLFWKGPAELSTCSVGEVQGGSAGTFDVYLEEWDGSTETVRVCACDLACTSYIPAGTKIIAHPIETRYIGE